jgi:drug/metabolite transporter (DMT)-like permease
VLAFALVYVSWGTTYLAISKGVETLPPALFSGTRFFMAGLIVLGFEAFNRKSILLPRTEFFWIFVTSIFLFVGGSGLLAVGEQSVASGIASILIATTPLWMALLERLAPRGERLNAMGWCGLFAGLGGVIVLLAPGLENSGLLQDKGPFLVLGSAFSWALGAFVVRRRRLHASHLIVAAYQMLLGGASLSLVGLACGEAGNLTAEAFTSQAVLSYFYLLVVGSLVGFIAYNWLLGHASLTMVGTYAYVNPIVAILVGCILNGEAISPWIVGGMIVILAGVAAVRSGEIPARSVATQPLPQGDYEFGAVCAQSGSDLQISLPGSLAEDSKAELSAGEALGSN